MEFDVTNLDKRELIQALFAHAGPVGLGEVEYQVRKIKDDNVDGLSDGECLKLLENYRPLDYGVTSILDYCKGKPIKLSLFTNKNGSILVGSESYDQRNGKYRFFEALLNVFHLDEIYITKKGYRKFVLNEIPNYLVRSQEDEMKFKNILKNTAILDTDYGKCWVIDKQKVNYTPPYLIF